jgi:hypothetical protein
MGPGFRQDDLSGISIVPGSQDHHSHTPQRDEEADARPISNRRLAMFFVALAIALVLGYLLLSKLVDMSQEEDCALAHRRNCGASEMPSTSRLASADARQPAGP